MKINVQKLTGNWKAGWALDLHTVSSKILSDGTFDTKYTEIGKLLYLLKYHFDDSTIEPIADTAAGFLKKRLVFPYLAAIIFVPPSNLNRPFQPVKELAISIGKKLKLPVPLDYLKKVKKTEPIKGIEDTESRKKELKGTFKVKDSRFANKYVLLFDDLFRSGETLNEITNVLIKQGKVSKVFVLTITKTRIKK